MVQTQYRAEFDARVEFTNGGHLEVTGFRVDVPHADVSATEVGTLFVTSLGLLMSGAVAVDGLRVFPEAHKGTRGGPSAASDTSDTSDTQTRDDRTFAELSHVIRDGMTTIPGLPSPVISAHLTRADSRTRYAAGTEFEINQLSLVGNTGTYLDSPFHRFADGSDLSAVPVDRVADLPTVVVRTAGSGVRAVDVGELAALDVGGKAVLLHTGGDEAFGSPAYAENAPFLTGAGARWLVEHDAALVGIDSINIDSMEDTARPAHTALLAAGIPIVEHLTGLHVVPPHGARFTAAPPRLERCGTFPVRAFATW